MTGNQDTKGNRKKAGGGFHLRNAQGHASRERNVPMIALSQLSRATECGGSKRPQLSDLQKVGRHRAGC